MNAGEFRSEFVEYLEEFKKIISTDDGEWVIKGFIDIYKNIYTISVDTKVVSKIIELLLFPAISRFVNKKGYTLKLSEHQNHYPDISIITRDESIFALDLKSTNRINQNQVNGFTLGAFTGYFRQRNLSKNITFPYNKYKGHFVLGTIYSRCEEHIDERKKFSIDELQNIVSVLKDFTFLLQEKWRVEGTKPGSGNTKNIGSIKNIKDLIEGKGPFYRLGEDVFNDYWMNYLTKDMARAIDSHIPYKNFDEYLKWRKL